MTLIVNNVIIFPSCWLNPDVAFSSGDTLGNLMVYKTRMRIVFKANG